MSRHITFFFQAEDGIRDLVRSRGLGDVYKRQHHGSAAGQPADGGAEERQQAQGGLAFGEQEPGQGLSLIHI